jgi:hypothetical protein
MAKQTYTTGQVLTAAQMTTLQANDYNWTVSPKTANYTLVAADAGTRITMTNASATVITVNTGVFTAGDTLEIINVGAGVCTVTAGTATVDTAGSLALTQFESGILYFSTTGAAIFFDYTQISGAAAAGTLTGTTLASNVINSSLTSFGTAPVLTSPQINLLLNAQTGTTYTFVLADNGKLVTASNALAQTYTIPTNASVAYPVGAQINLIQIGVGQVTISGSGGVTVASNAATSASPKCRNQYASLTCIKVATDTWYVIGDIA